MSKKFIRVTVVKSVEVWAEEPPTYADTIYLFNRSERISYINSISVSTNDGDAWSEPKLMQHIGSKQ